MKVNDRIPCPGVLFFILTALIFVCFCYWLFSESDDEKIHDIFMAHDQLVLEGKRKEAGQLFHKALEKEGSGPLDPIWLPLVRARGNGYEQLVYHLRILQADPENEETYKSIANLVEFAPEAFHLEVKENYYTELARVTGVRPDLLKKYDLLSNPSEIK